MSAEAESFLFGPQGPVNTGTGHQFIGSTFVLNSLEQLVRMGRTPRAVASERLDWLEQRFVEPDHYGRARQLLADKGCLLLTGALGSGRRATAQMLLHRQPGAQGLIRELPDTGLAEASNEPVLDASAVDSGQRLLLDLSIWEDDEKGYGALVGQLPAYRDVVQQCGAHLVVILPHSRKYLELGPPDVDIVRPNGERVFRRYLRVDDITRDAQLDGEELTRQLRVGPMRHIAELAKLVREAKESAPAQTFAYWLKQALTALTARSAEVARQMKTLRGGQRVLLLTTAMFSGAHADAIFALASRLRALDRHPEDERPRLEREGLMEQLAEIGARADAAGRVHFTLLAYDQAVRIHFWTNFPDVRKDFCKWVGTALGHQALSDDDRNAVVTRFAEQALRTSRPDDLRYLIERWVKRTDPRWPSRWLPQAARAVEHGLGDERHGVFFRQQLYKWSRDPALPLDLAQIVVRMCLDVLALTYPEQAVVRLHHIVRRHSDTVGVAARDALLALMKRDSRLYRFLLGRVRRGLMTVEYAAADLALFLELTAPDLLIHSSPRTPPLITDETVYNQLVTGWRAALDGSPSLSCTHYVQTWLEACEDEQYRELLLTVLVKAGDERIELLSRLYVMACGWAHAVEECRQKRARVADCLNNKIDSALGIDFAGLDLGDRAEGTPP